MRPLFTRNSFWVYPVYGSIGGAFGYWLQGVERRQIAFLSERRDALHEKRRRRSEREGVPEFTSAGEKTGGMSVTGAEGRTWRGEGGVGT